MKTPLYGTTVLAGLALFILSAVTTRGQIPDSSPPQIITIEDAVQYALARDPVFLRDSAQLASRSASVRAAFGTFLPSIALRGNYVKYLNDVGTVTGGLELASSRPSTELSGGASASLELFDGFSRSANYNAAGHERDAAALTMLAHQAEVAYQVRRAFIDLMKSETSAEVRQSELATLLSQRERLAGRVESGVALRLDLEAIDAEIAMARYNLLVAENSSNVLVTTLAATLNFDPSRRIDVSPDGLPVDLDSGAVAGLIAELASGELSDLELIGRRSDIAARRSALLAAEERVTVARSGRFPTVGASIGVNHYRSGPIAQTTGTLGIDLQYVLFDQFRTDEAVAISEAALLNARLDLRQLELDIRQSLIAARSRLDGATALLHAARVSVDAARRSRESALQRHEAGVGDFNDVLIATGRYVEARINAINAGYDWWNAYYDVLRVEGRVYPGR